MDGTLPVKLQPSNLRPIAYRIFSKKHGLNIKTDGLVVLTEMVSYRFGSEWRGSKSQQFMEEIAKIWKTEERGLFLDGAGLRQVSKELNKKEPTKTGGSGAGLDSMTSSTSLISRIPTSISSNGDTEEPPKATRSDTVADVEEVINWKDYFKVINPNEQPNFKFDRHRKQFTLQKNGQGLKDNLANSVEMFNSRYQLISDRLSRHENFQKNNSISSIHTSLNGGSTAPNNEISLVKNVVGRDGSVFILFGLLSKNSNGDFILEDSTDYIELDLSQTDKAEGCFYTTGMFVIAEGIYSASGGNSNKSTDYIGGIFHVSVIGHPPAEKREVTNENYGNIDFLGIQREDSTGAATGDKVTKVNKSWRKKLVALERSLQNHKLILLGSDCFLDDFKILDGLKKLFGQIESSLIDEPSEPLAIVLTGSFNSKPLTATNGSPSLSNSELYKSNFDSLANILSSCPKILNTCKIVLIPGKNDPWQSSYSLGNANIDYLPQRNIPRMFVNRLERLLPRGNLILGWNPVRINYLSQELVIMKSELMHKLKRNDIVFQSDLKIEKEILQLDLKDDNVRISELVQQPVEFHVPSPIKQARKLVKTLLDQGNLQPFLPDLKLVNSSYDNVLRIEPLPTVLILQDTGVENFEVTYNGCKVINLASLLSKGTRKLNYVEYFPSQKRFEFKQVYF